MMSPNESTQFDLPFAEEQDGLPSAMSDQAEAASVAAHAPLSDSLEALMAEMVQRGVEPARTIVLLPYTQLLEPARQAWFALFPNGFPPRFETTRSWAMATGPHVASPTDWTGDAARDALVAQSLLRQASQLQLPGSMRTAVTERILEAARQLAPLAAACKPDERADWAASHKGLTSSSMQSVYWESLASTLALTWVGLSAFVTDWLWAPQTAPGLSADLLLIVPGLQREPLTMALAKSWGERAHVLPALRAGTSAAETGSQRRFFACAQADEEAREAAACVVSHINAKRTPVALVAQDRILTRRISALLGGLGVRLRDETGWKLSTTHAAAQLMALLRAAQPGARVDDVLDFLKLCAPDASVLRAESSSAAETDLSRQPVEAGAADTGGLLDQLELRARRLKLSRWASLIAHPDMQEWLPGPAVSLLANLAASRSLVEWLEAVRNALVSTGWAMHWVDDAAGKRLLATLRLESDGAQEWRLLLGDALLPQRMSLGGFTSWVRQTLESATFMPGDDRHAQVVVLPLAQLPGRAFGACVMAGCDETHLIASPDPVGTWSQEQREALGLPDRTELAGQAKEAWQHVVGQPWIDILWREAEGTERLNAAAWVQDLLTSGSCASASNETQPHACLKRELQADAIERPPAPVANGLKVPQVSSTHYQDLRDCPYRYFAMRLMGLRPVEELEQSPGKREWGVVLHAVLRRFHEERRDGLLLKEDESERLDRLMHEESARAGLMPEGHAGEFHPFIAAWPKVRDGYLGWLYRPLSEGGGAGLTFQRGEARMRGSAGAYAMVGDIDRIDQDPDGATWVIDYKTGSLQSLRDRVADPMEDTQTAFYAALMDGDASVRAAYLSVSDSKPEGSRKQPTTMVEQSKVALVREALIDGIVADLSRIETGHPLKAMGEGSVCDHCQARGLCRKDFWEQEA